MKYTLATFAFSATSTCCLDEWRLVDAELDVVEWRGQDASGRVGVVPIASGPCAGEGHGEVPSDWRRRL
jgi:hypothetical protein